jgi:hypothetical protein
MLAMRPVTQPDVSGWQGSGRSHRCSLSVLGDMYHCVEYTYRTFIKPPSPPNMNTFMIPICCGATETLEEKEVGLNPGNLAPRLTLNLCTDHLSMLPFKDGDTESGQSDFWVSGRGC